MCENMKWKQIRVKTTTAAEDVIISALYDIGLEGAQIEDNVPLTDSDKGNMFVGISPETEPEMKPDDQIAYLNFFVEDEDVDMEEMVEKVKVELAELSEFMDIGEGTVTLSETEDIDWINNWKEFFHQFTVEDLLVVPTWEEIPEEDQGKTILRIDPGTAFGTGAHETTQLCIKQLKKYVTKDTELLDIGCGSGILGIVALLFGAKGGKGTDLDANAIDATIENMERNNLPADKFQVQIGNIITDKSISDSVGYECYDIVTAIILADVLIPLTPVIIPHLKEGGLYITSGIINEKEESVAKAITEAGLRIIETNYQGEWVNITAQK
jgi:ribosomal protein L11 methyltransferase